MSSSSDQGAAVRRLFDEVVDLAPAARAAYLDQACRDDPALRREIESLLEAYPQVDEILDAYEQPLLAPQALNNDRPTDAQRDPLGLVGQTVSHYQVLAWLGGGGMGVVYQARDTKLDRMVALKFLPPELTRHPEARQRFMHEAKAASALDHANICTVYEIGETDQGQTFIAMAYYAGETLRAKIARGPLPLKEALYYAMQMAEGLSRAHAAGIAHRDVKPANVMVTEQRQVKIVDFGLAKVQDVSLTKTGTTMGTVSYMSPEQALGEHVDHRTDVWSLGVVLYEMLTGERPFRGDYAEAVIYAIRHDAPRPLTTLRGEAPASLAQIVEKTLAKLPEERYQQAQELQVDLMLVDLASPRGEGEAVRPAADRAVVASSRRRRVVRYRGVAALLLVLAGLGYLLGQLGLGASSSPVPSEDRPLIAVLPLENRSGEQEEAYFAESMTDEVRAMLTRIEGLRVASRQSLMQFKAPGQPLSELARQLQADYFVHGSVSWAGEQVRINLELVDPTTETNMLAESFVDAKRDVLGLQRKIARAMARAVEVQLTPGDEARLGTARAVDPEAYALYSRGRHLSATGLSLPEQYQRKAEYFKQAIARDSSFAEAHAALAGAYWWLGGTRAMPREEAALLLEKHLDKALEIDERLPIAYSLKGLYLQVSWKWTEAEEAFRRAVELEPGNVNALGELGLFLDRREQFQEALDLGMRAHRLHPVSPFPYLVIVRVYLHTKRYDEAIEWTLEWREVRPYAFPFLLGEAYLRLGRHQEGLALFEEAVAADSSRIGQLGYAYALAGRRQEALRALNTLDVMRERGEHVSLPDYRKAVTYAALGETDLALDWLERAFASRDMESFNVELAFEPLHAEPRFQALLQEMGLAP